MAFTCTRCGGPVQNARVIVQGQSVNNSKTDLAWRLSSDRPKPMKWGWCLFGILAFTAMFILPFSLCIGSNQISNLHDGSTDLVALALLIVSIILFFAMFIATIVVGRMLGRRDTRKYNEYVNQVLDRRYFCHGCGNIMNV